MKGLSEVPSDDIIKRAMVDVDRWLADQGGRALMVMQVHDELVFEVEAGFVDTLLAEAKLRMERAAHGWASVAGGRMPGATSLRVPLVVDAGVGDNWDQAH